MYYELTAPQFAKVLNNLVSILGKAEAFATERKIQPEVLLQSRLFPDQFPLMRQIQIACDAAKLGVARLTGKTAPVNEDTEVTMADARARIQSTVQFLNSVNAADFADAENKSITNQWWNGKSLSGKDYFAQHLIPNFYFHITTAYAILRKNGVTIGKHDFLGELPFRSN